MIVALRTDGESLSRLLAPYLPKGIRVEFFVTETLKVGLHAKGQYVKVKLAMRAEKGDLVLDIKDLMVNGVSLGGNHFEQFVPDGSYGPLRLRHEDGSMRLSYQGISFRPSGVLNGSLSIMAEVEA